MWLLYQALVAVLLAVAGPILLARRGRRYLPVLRERLSGRRPAGPRRALWIHAVSVGEVGVAATLARALPAGAPAAGDHRHPHRPGARAGAARPAGRRGLPAARARRAGAPLLHPAASPPRWCSPKATSGRWSCARRDGAPCRWWSSTAGSATAASPACDACAGCLGPLFGPVDALRRADRRRPRPAARARGSTASGSR